MRCFLCVVALVFVSSLLCTIPAQQSHSETSISIPKEYVPAATDVPSILKKAEAGDAKAQLTLAVAYLAGIGVDKDQAESVKWLRKAADNNLMDAEELLGVFYSAGGTGVGHDDTEAFRWLSKAAAQGSPSAQMTVGYRYAMGVGVAEDHTAAAQWFKKAADQEYVDGEFFYGLALMNGDGVEKDTQAALGWLQTAADAGDGRACAAIAQIYGRGMGVPKDDVKAASFLRKAVDLTPDNKIFWNNLAWLLATSTTEGVRNPADALKAALKAAQLTDSNDPTVLDTLAEAYFINGKVDDAIATQRKAVSLAPDKKEYQEHLDRLMRGTKQISN